MEVKCIKMCVDEFAEDGSIFDSIDTYFISATGKDVKALCQSAVENDKIDIEDSIPHKAKDSYILKIETNTDGYDFVIAVYSTSDKNERKLYNGYCVVEDVLPEHGGVVINVV